MRKKHNIESVKVYFKENGYELLGSEYTNIRIPLLCKCPKGHLNKINYSNFIKGTRCRKCSYELRSIKNRYTLEFVENIFNEKGYKLLTSKYKNNKQKLEYICPEGHKHSVSLYEFMSGTRCLTCYNERRKHIGLLEYDYIKSEFEKREYTILSNKYVGCTKKLNVVCPNLHNIEISWADFQQGHGCRKCGNIKISESLRLNIKEISDAFDKEGYKLLTKKYINGKQKLDYICPEGHRGSTNFNNWKDKGTRCSTCFNSRSKMEIELFEFLQQYFPNIEANDRILIAPLELDIVIPSKKVAIEFCGVFWHNDENKTDNRYHLNKLERCNDIGYNLITIFEDEWIYKKDIVKSRLKSILKLNNGRKIYARNCIIKEIDTVTKNIFLNEYHIQGSDTSSINLGAFYKDVLVSVMTFSLPSISKGSKNRNKNIYELNRFCSDRNYNIVGIASKLLSHFIKNYMPDNIFSYSDRRWSTGNLYKVLGFSHEHNSKPNYWYVVGNNRKHRFNFRKSVLNKKLEHFNPDLTEVENMKANGYSRIFDCGNSKWILHIN